jgi:hypothetical protein
VSDVFSEASADPRTINGASAVKVATLSCMNQEGGYRMCFCSHILWMQIPLGFGKLDNIAW